MRSGTWFLLLLAAMATSARAQSGFDIQQTARSTHRRAVGAHPAVAYPLNHIFASHFYDTDAEVQDVAVELRLSAWPETDRPWQDTEWRRKTGLSDSSTFPVHIWRRRGDYVCPVQTFIVPLYPRAEYQLTVDPTSFRAGDWMYVEPSDAFTISTYRRNTSVAASEWTLITSVKTNASYDWRAPHPTPPWGDSAPFVDCSKPE